MGNLLHNHQNSIHDFRSKYFKMSVNQNVPKLTKQLPKNTLRLYHKYLLYFDITSCSHLKKFEFK